MGVNSAASWRVKQSDLNLGDPFRDCPCDESLPRLSERALRWRTSGRAVTMVAW